MFGSTLYGFFCVLMSSIASFLYPGNIQVKFHLEESGFLLFICLITTGIIFYCYLSKLDCYFKLLKP